jgi:hypothetical protein
MSNSTGANNLLRFVNASNSAAAPSLLSAASTPMSFTTIAYGGYSITRDPDPVDAADVNPPAVRREWAARALFSVVSIILASAPAYTQQTSLGTDDWERWFSLIITTAHLVVDSPIQDQGIGAAVQALSGAQVNDLYAAMRAFVSGGTPAAYIAACTAVHADLRLPPMGAVTVPAAALLSASGAPTERWALYAIMMYLMGRPVSSGRTAGVVKRMKNLCDKGNRGATWATIGGLLKPSDGAVTLIGLAWEKDGRFRAAMFRPMIGYARKLGDMNETMMSTIVGLLPMSQMAHVRILMDFLYEYEFVAQMPELQAELSELAVSAETWATFPERERPFAKMLWRDQFKAFDSKRLVRIIKLAVDKLSVGGSPTGAYAVRGADQALSDAFDARRTAWLAAQAPALGGAAPAPGAPAAP